MLSKEKDAKAFVKTKEGEKALRRQKKPRRHEEDEKRRTSLSGLEAIRCICALLL